MSRDPPTKKASWDEFECPECTAQNLWSDRFAVGDEIYCMYCGAVFEVRLLASDGETARYKLVLQ